MKAKRTPLNVVDFSGGLNTNPPQTDVDPKFTPDCLNVYAEGPALRKRFGFTHVNTASAGTLGNGIYNWVINSSLQYLVGLFDSTLKRMSTSGTTWSGTWSSISVDSANGTPFSSALMHFVTYQGTLIMTTEARDKPQRITATDTSYKNLNTGGTGTVPFAKYCQIWKEHVWLLNISAGGILTEDCGSLSSWTTLDISTGVTSTSTFNGQQTFRFHGGAGAGSDAHIKRTASSITTAYSVEIRTDFATLGAITGGDYAYMDIANGVIRNRTRWSTDGLEIFDGTNWKEVSVNTVSTGTWITWKLLVTAGTATASYVDVFKDGSAVGLQFSAANASTASSGQIDLAANAGGSLSQIDWYMDYIYLNSIVVRSNYYTDGVFNSWVSSSQASYTDNALPSLIPYSQFKFEDNAGSSTVTDSGSGTNNGTMNAGASTINTSLVSNVGGKITRAFSFTSASSHFVSMAGGFVSTVATNTAGTISMWVNPNSGASSRSLLSVSGSALNSYFWMYINTGGNVTIATLTAGSIKMELSYTPVVSTGTYTHLALVQNGTAGPNLFINNSLGTPNYSTNTDKSSWIATAGGTLDTALIGAIKVQSLGPLQFYTGLIDDFRYYQTSLSTSEIQSIYADGNGNQGQPATVREGTTIYLGTFSYRVNNNGEYAVVSQTLTSSANIAGTPLIMGEWFFGTNNSTYKLRVNDGIANYDSPVLTANGTWQYQTLAFTPMSGATAIRVQTIGLSSGTFYVDQVAVVNASVGITVDYSDRLQRSVSGTYDTWTGGDSGSNDITTPQDVGLTGSFILQDRMYVTKAWNIYRITYTGSIPLLDIKQARSVVGTRSPRATRNIDLAGVGEVVIFLGTDRNLYLFDGFASTPLNDNISLNNGMASVYTNNINTQALDKVFAVNHSNIGCYEIFLPIGDATVPTHSLFYNYKTKAFWPFDNRNFLSGNVSDDGNGERVIMVVGASNGITYEINTDQTTSDDGSAINAYWNSFKLGEDYILGKNDEVRLATDAVSAIPTFKWRSNYESSYDTVTLSSGINSHVYDPKRVGNLIQFQVGDNSTGAIWKLWHLKALERGLGIGS